jgi:hypothetical protein
VKGDGNTEDGRDERSPQNFSHLYINLIFNIHRDLEGSLGCSLTFNINDKELFPKTNKKVVNTTQIPVNVEDCQAPRGPSL